MDPSLIALLAVIASAVQVLLLRLTDYYWPKGHNRADDRIAETKAGRRTRHDHDAKVQRKVVNEQDDDFTIVEGGGRGDDDPDDDA